MSQSTRITGLCLREICLRNIWAIASDTEVTRLELGIRGQCRRIALPHHPAFFDDEMVIGNLRHLVDVFVDQQYGQTELFQALQASPDFLADQRRQARASALARSFVPR